jgi:O-antigen/teichoic acid export membrane protein
VFGPICRVVVQGIGLQICHPWRPRFVLQVRDSLHWVKFGLKASASQIVYHLYTNVDYQIVGYMFGERANGLYWFAYELVLKPCFLIAQTLQAIAFPAYAKLQHAREQLVEQFMTFTRLSLVVMLSFLALVVVSADDILFLVWGEAGTYAAPAARILCAVGVLRALSFVVPPLLDGVGRPGLSLTYNLVAAVTLPSMFFAAAHILGPHVGYLSVAYAWVVGYPIAFAVLLFMAFNVLELRVTTYLRRVFGIPLCAAGAIGAGFGARLLAESLGAGPRLLITTVTIAVSFGVLLSNFQGMGPKALIRALKGN